MISSAFNPWLVPVGLLHPDNNSFSLCSHVCFCKYAWHRIQFVQILHGLWFTCVSLDGQVQRFISCNIRLDYFTCVILLSLIRFWWLCGYHSRWSDSAEQNGFETDRPAPPSWLHRERRAAGTEFRLLFLPRSCFRVSESRSSMFTKPSGLYRLRNFA